MHSRRKGFALVLGMLLAGAAYAGAEQPAKRHLSHQDCDQWRSIQNPVLSPDGRYLAYTLTPQEGDAEVVVRDLQAGTDRRFMRGSRPAAPTTPTEGAPAVSPGRRPVSAPSARMQFAPDSRTLVFTTTPTKAATEQARKEKKKPDDMPKPGLMLVDLASGETKTIDNVRGFQAPEETGSHIVYSRNPPGGTQDEASRDNRQESVTTGQRRGRAPTQNPPETSPRPPRKEYGTELVIQDLNGGDQRVIADILDYSLTKDGKTLVYVVSAKDEGKNGVYTLRPGSTESPFALLCGKGRYQKLTWDEKQTRLAFLSDHESGAPASAAVWRLYHWQRDGTLGKITRIPFMGHHLPHMNLAELFWRHQNQNREIPAPALVVAAPTLSNFRNGWVINERGALGFSHDGDDIFFGTSPAPEPEKPKTDASPVPAEDKVLLDLWHWRDDFIQPMQKVCAEQDRNRTYRAVVHLKDLTFQQVGDETMNDLTPSANGEWAIGADDRPHRTLVGHDGNYSDYVLISTRDGKRIPLLTKQRGGPSFSTTGKYMLYFDGKDWNTLNVPDAKLTNITKDLKVSFAREDVDTPSAPPAYGVAGWTNDDASVLLYDRYDIWELSPDGSRSRNITMSGRKDGVQFRLVKLDPDKRHYDTQEPWLLRAENQTTRDTGFYRLRTGSPPQLLVMAGRNFSVPTKAKHADVLMLTASTFYDAPELYVTDPEFRDLRKVSDANQQKAPFVWGKSEMIRYKNLDGVPLQGVLIKPENMEAGKKYPMIVYIYERLSQNLHQFVEPRPGTSINPSFYASNGYLVLMPDIVYTIGYPGQSAMKCVLPAIQAVVDQGIVDENAIGIQGHSWGGYQISYMITQTNRFKAAAAGAPVANMTSAYNGIRWGSGMPRQWQYERAQSRIGGNLWQHPLRFIENSPIFMADRVQTPLLMLHNDQDDAVPWYQGIEYFLALRRLGKEVYLFNYNGEPHGLRKRANQKDFAVRMQQFFDHHLKGAPMPEWMSKGVPFLDREKEKERLKPALVNQAPAAATSR